MTFHRRERKRVWLPASLDRTLLEIMRCKGAGERVEPGVLEGFVLQVDDRNGRMRPALAQPRKKFREERLVVA